MAFTAALRNDVLAVEAGSSTPLVVEVTNKGETNENVELQIEGIDSEWTAVPVPVLEVRPGETVSAKLFLKPPRVSESVTGNYPFVLRVRSLETGDQRTLQGVLQIKPFHYVTMEISPKKGMFSATKQANHYTVTVVNLGNTEHTLQLSGNDPEDACTFEFGAEQLTLGPGQQRDVEVLATPGSKPLVSSSRLIGFSITGRSLTTPQVVATAQAQLEQRPLLTPASLVTFLALAAIIALWIITLPKPPTVQLRLDPRSPVVGQNVSIQWSTQFSTGVEVFVNDVAVADSNDPSGSTTYTVAEPGVLTISAVPRRDSKKGERVELRIPILTPEIAPDPTIDQLDVTPKALKLGEPFVIRYKFNSAVTKAKLSPSNEVLDLNLSQMEVKPLRSGKLDYEIVAENKDGKVVRRAFSVDVVDASEAAILAFSTDTVKLPLGGGPVSVTWQVSNAARIELQVGSESQRMVLQPEGSTVINIAQKTMLKLIAFDSKGRSVTRTTTIEVENPTSPLPEDPRTNPGGQGSPLDPGKVLEPTKGGTL